MSNHPYVHIVILTHNGCEYTIRAIDSLKTMTYPNYDLVVVDNRSTDTTVEKIREKYPFITLLIQPSNKGFAAAANSGLQRAMEQKADYALIINNDVLVMPSMLTHLIEAMTPDVGAAAPMIYFLDNPKQIWSIGFARHPFLLEAYGGARGQIDEGQWLVPVDVDYLLGCALLLRVSVLEEVGLFDDRFFFYYEDLDLCLRIQKKGYRLITVPKAKMWHKVAGSANLGSPFRVYHMARSSIIFFQTHAKGIQRPAILMYRLGSIVKNSSMFLARRRYDLFQHYWKGLWNGWQLL